MLRTSRYWQDALRVAIAEKASNAKTVNFKILLRLNLDETDHIELARLLDDLRKEGKVERQETAVVKARLVLQREWAVAKYGIWADLRLYLKRARRRSWRLVKQRMAACRHPSKAIKKGN